MTEKPSKQADVPKRRTERKTIGFQLLVAVNSTLAVVLALFLVYDYRREFADRLNEKHIALEEEAKTLLPAVMQMRHHGVTEIQRFIDDVCALMHDNESPGHHIVVRLDGEIVQAAAHHRASPEMVEAMQRAAESPTKVAVAGNTQLVVGAFKKNGSTVYVSEELAKIRTAVIGDLFLRAAGVAALGLVAAVVVNVVLWRVVTRPLHQLVDTMQKIGQGQLGLQSSSFTSAELDYLADEINSMSHSLAEADYIRKAQMNRARQIQDNLLPGNVDTPGMNIAHLFQPADDVGGDYYDILPLNDGSWLFCVADVTGHGVPAAMSAAMLKTLLLQAVERHSSPADILKFINERFTTVSLPDEFVSMLILRAMPEAGCLKYASAGHEIAWLLSPAGAIRELPSTGLIIGVEEDAEWDNKSLNVERGDRLLMVTDGVTETFNLQEENFCQNRLVDTFCESKHDSVDHVVRRIQQALESFRNGAAQHDDLTLVLVELGGKSNTGEKTK